VALLIRRIGFAEREVAAMTKDEAIARLSRYWSTGRRDRGSAGWRDGDGEHAPCPAAAPW
jgi:hypothetical protein